MQSLGSGGFLEINITHIIEQMIGFIKQGKRIKIIASILIVILCSGCNYRARNIQDLEKEQKDFLELPKAVQDIFIDPSEFKNVTDQGIVYGYLDLICPEERDRYELRRKHFFIESWIAYYIIRDTQLNIEYKVDYGFPFPLIIYDGTLYIQEKYNVLGSNIDYELLEFTCYILEDEK